MTKAGEAKQASRCLPVTLGLGPSSALNPLRYATIRQDNPIQSNEYNGSRPRPLFPSLSKNLKYKNTNKLKLKLFYTSGIKWLSSE